MNADNTILICAPNWLGDAVMCMPAIRRYKQLHPAVSVVVLSKSALGELWPLNPDISETLTFSATVKGTLDAATLLRKRKWGRAYVLPNSFRSALIPFLAGIPERIGFGGHGRTRLLNRIVPNTPALAHQHQSREYTTLFGLDGGETDLAPPFLILDPDTRDNARNRLALPSFDRLAGFIPGAARGPSKRWPVAHFIAAGRQLADSADARIVVLGAPDETDLCRAVAEGIGPAAVDLGGRTPLPQFAAILALCRVAIANDSGGMHLAAAMGTPVVAIYGITDPVKTGPLGSGHRIVALDNVPRARDIQRASEAARHALHGIEPNRVCKEAIALLDRETS